MDRRSKLKEKVAKSPPGGKMFRITDMDIKNCCLHFSYSRYRCSLPVYRQAHTRRARLIPLSCPPLAFAPPLGETAVFQRKHRGHIRDRYDRFSDTRDGSTRSAGGLKIFHKLIKGANTRNKCTQPAPSFRRDSVAARHVEPCGFIPHGSREGCTSAESPRACSSSCAIQVSN